MLHPEDASRHRFLPRGESRMSPPQERVLAAVRSHPGAVISDLADVLGCSYSNVSRHLENLCRLGLLVREKHGRGVRHYCVLDNVVEIQLAAHCRDERRCKVIRLLANHPDRAWIANEIARHVGVDRGFIQRLLRRLREQGLVRVHHHRSRRYIQAVPKLAAAVHGGAARAPHAGDAGDGP